jgi:hypothetical protein
MPETHRRPRGAAQAPVLDYLKRHHGEPLSMAEISRETGVPVSSIYSVIYRLRTYLDGDMPRGMVRYLGPPDATDGPRVAFATDGPRVAFGEGKITITTSNGVAHEFPVPPAMAAHMRGLDEGAQPSGTERVIEITADDIARAQAEHDRSFRLSTEPVHELIMVEDLGAMGDGRTLVRDTETRRVGALEWLS